MWILTKWESCQERFPSHYLSIRMKSRAVKLKPHTHTHTHTNWEGSCCPQEKKNVLRFSQCKLRRNLADKTRVIRRNLILTTSFKLHRIFNCTESMKKKKKRGNVDWRSKTSYLKLRSLNIFYLEIKIKGKELKEGKKAKKRREKLMKWKKFATICMRWKGFERNWDKFTRKTFSHFKANIWLSLKAFHEISFKDI